LALTWVSLQLLTPEGLCSWLRERLAALLFLGQIKREKGVWWMPWQQEAMKDVIPCVKPWGAGNRL